MKVDVPKNPICVAIDSAQEAEIQGLMDELHNDVGLFKVGLTALYGVGSETIRTLERHGRPLFVDAKLHDIPAQIDGAVHSLRRLQPDLVTVHASGGSEMLRAAVKAAQEEFTILAVTVLTSLDDELLASVGIGGPVIDAVLRLAEVALEAGAGGLVCSPSEVQALRDRFGSRADGGPLLVVPGIRPSGQDTHDQRRTMSPAEALEAGADILVVGRPITGAKDPVAAARVLLREVAV